MNAKRKMMGGIAMAGLLVAGSMVRADVIDVLNYTFSNSATESWTGNSVQELKDAGWTATTPADSNTAFYVDPTGTAGNGTMTGVLWLKDDVNGATDALGRPQVVKSFGDLSNGVLSIRYCGAGSPNYWAQVRLFDGATELALTEITSNSAGTVQTGAGSTALPLVTGTGNRAQNIELSWIVNGDGTGSQLTVKLNGTAVVTTQAFKTAGIPDSFALRVGMWNSVGRYMVVDSIHLTTDAVVPEPASVSLLGLGVLALVCRSGWRRRIGD